MCLKIVTTTLTWSEALALCEEDGASLVKIESAEQNNHLKNIVVELGTNFTEVFSIQFYTDLRKILYQ